MRHVPYRVRWNLGSFILRTDPISIRCDLVDIGFILGLINNINVAGLLKTVRASDNAKVLVASMRKAGEGVGMCMHQG